MKRLLCVLALGVSACASKPSNQNPDSKPEAKKISAEVYRPSHFDLRY